MAEASLGVQAASRTYSSFLLFEQFHIHVAMVFEPRLVDLSIQCPRQAQAARRVRKDTYYPRPTFDLFVQPFERVGALHVLMVLPR